MHFGDVFVKRPEEEKHPRDKKHKHHSPGD
jgi:hypothetical protein